MAPGQFPFSISDHTIPRSVVITIDTMNPGATLEVNGAAKIDGVLAVGNGGILFPDDGSTRAQLGLQGGADATPGYLNT